jgi:hypothetical protein
MGHTLPSTTQLVLKEFSGLKPLYDALRRSDQLVLDAFFEAILQHRAAIGEALNNMHLLPMEIMPLVILLEERKRNSHVHIELFGQIEELDRRLGLLSPPDEAGEL